MDAKYKCYNIFSTCTRNFSSTEATSPDKKIKNMNNNNNNNNKLVVRKK